jgi:MarR family transcriptional regulator, transcriptional regulator for hemolysin
LASNPRALILSSQRTCQRTPEEQIGFLLKRLMHQFRHQIDERLRRGSDLSFAHLVTLDQLQQEPGVAGARLARSLLVTAQTMTGLLRRLEREGSVERRPDPHNRRADRWYLLPAGMERLAAARGAGAPVMTQMLSRLSAEEVSGLRGYLERCVEGLESEGRREASEPVPRNTPARPA